MAYSFVSPLTTYTEQQRLPLITKAVFSARSAALFTKQVGIKSAAALNLMDTDANIVKGGIGYKEDIVVDPFMGSGTSAVAAEFVGRNWVGIELSPNYTEVANKRLLEYRAKLLQMKLELEEVSKF